MMQAYHEALEGSVQTHFQGNLINCMSCANEMFYSLLNSTVTRTSTDFWPNRPESHGLHLYCNAQVSAWFGEFAQPDWDMFQSGHEMGAFHAAGRAISGGPVYVSDKVGAHNFALLKKLVLPDGTVPRCDYPGRPTRDCLFQNPTKDDVLLKIWNTNGQEEAGVIGVFHARYGDAVGAISGSVSPADVPLFWGEQFAVYAHHAGELRLLTREQSWELTLEPLTAELFTLVPVQEGFAPIGLASLFNSYGSIIEWIPMDDGRQAVDLVTGGEFIAYSATQPARLVVNSEEISFDYDATTGVLRADVPAGREITVLFIEYAP
jgi:raffinose synthase